MNVVAVGLVAAFAVFAVADWLAAWRDHRRQRAITKPAATVMLVAIAALVGQMAGDARAALIVAVVLCLAGESPCWASAMPSSSAAWARSRSATPATS